VSADRVHCALQQQVAGSVTLRVVDGLQPDHVDVGDYERSHRSMGTIDLLVNRLQTGRARSRPGQPVRLRDRSLAQQLVAFGLGLQPLTSGLLTITGRLLAIHRRPGSRPLRRGTIRDGSAAIIRGLAHILRPHTRRARIIDRQFAITTLGGTLARGRRQIARAGDPVTGVGRLQTRLGAVLALLGAAIASLARAPVYFTVAAGREVAIAGGLIAISCCLFSSGRGLIVLRPGLVSIRERLIAISPRLIVLTRL
jgi:hypothetical protein